MAHFVLVHGAYHGSWCWRHVLPRLDVLGHKATTVDLPGHAAGDAPRPDLTLDEVCETVIAKLTPDCILVGHSLGGQAITLAAAARPDLVGRLVSLAAHIPISGTRLHDIRQKVVTPDALSIAKGTDGLAHIVDHDLAETVFYNDCNPTDRAFAREHLVPQTMSVLLEVMEFELGDLDHHYIICEDDRTVRPEFQIAVTADWPKDRVHRMNSGHSPFFSDPDGLVALLDAIARQTT